METTKEILINTQKTKFIFNEKGLYLRRFNSKSFYYIRLPIETQWTNVDSNLKKIKVNQTDYEKLNLQQFEEK